jgi:hypothetical protein
MNQFLNSTNIYQRQLIVLGNLGLRYIVACTKESCEPEYEGFGTPEAAIERCGQLIQRTGFTHAVYQLTQDQDGGWLCDYRDIQEQMKLKPVKRYYTFRVEWNRQNGELNGSASMGAKGVSQLDALGALIRSIQRDEARDADGPFPQPTWQLVSILPDNGGQPYLEK